MKRHSLATDTSTDRRPLAARAAAVDVAPCAWGGEEEREEKREGERERERERK